MSRFSWLQAAVLGVVVIAAMVAGGIITAEVTGGDDDVPLQATPTDTSTQTPVADTRPESPSTQAPGQEGAPLANLPDLVEQVRQSVVKIEAGAGGFGASVGTGMLIDDAGNILTNYHVIEGASSIRVTFDSGVAANAAPVGLDPGSDLAVIRIEGDIELPDPVTFGDSDAVRVGESVFAIGNPFSQEFSTTHGIISAINRSTQSAFTGRTIRHVLQTDAALNPGNSGGPLFNEAGEVIGVNTSIENPDGRFFAGLGFAVPSNTALRFLPQMLAGETVEHSQLGIGGLTVTEPLANELGLAVNEGVYVTTVTPGSAAEEAGLIPGGAATTGIPQPGGDVILAINGERTETFEELGTIIDEHDVGEEVTLTVQRGEQQLELTATLQPWSVDVGIR